MLRFATLLVAAVAPGAASAQTSDFTGKWVLALDSAPNTDYGILEFDQSGPGLRVFVDGGPVNLLSVDGPRIAFDLDWSDSADRVHVTVLAGEIANSELNGEMTEGGERTGAWRATPWAEHPDAGAAPSPVNIAGVWLSRSRGTHKETFDLTATGEAANAAYDPAFDDPHLRCVTGGMIRMEDGPFGYEIIQRDDLILVLYEYFHEVRRIWTDGRDFPDDIDDAYLSMGYSIGHWEGSTLVVETRGSKPTVWDANGMPVSASATVTERKYLDDQGRLHTDYTLLDPVNFSRPVYRHAYRERGDGAELNESSCDPHPFYRALQLEGRLQQYWGRSANRF